jgi:uncharacterized lipoprotein
MRSRRSIIVAIIIALSCASCAFTPQAVSLRPDVQVASPPMGQGRTVAVRVADERPRATLGTRGAQGVGAQITLQQDLPSVVQSAVMDGLKRQGFAPVAAVNSTEGRELRVEVRNLDYNVIVGFWAGTLRTECALKGICILGTTRPYEQLYRGVREETVLVIQGASANEEYVNDALSKAIQELLADSKLSQCLAQ